jgi:hypothetical protein
MLLLLLEIGLLVAGLIALVTGKFRLGKDRVVVGAVARVAGLVLMLPLPLGFAIGFMIGLQQTLQGKQVEAAKWQGTLALLEWGLVGGCALLGFGIARAARPDRQQAEAGPEAGPADESEDGITAQPPRPRAPAGGPGREARRRPTERPRRAAPSGLGVVWWVVGGVAAGFLLLAAAGGLLLWWALSVAPVPQPVGPDAGPAGPGAADDRPVDLADLWGPPPGRDAAEAELDTPSRPPFAVDPQLGNAGAACYLRDMRPFDSREGNNGWAGVSVTFEGHPSPHAVVIEPGFGGTVARRRYALGKQARVFRSGVGFTDDPNGYRRTFSPAVFVVLGDGKELWTSKAIGENGLSDECTLDVSNVEVLELRVRRGWGLGFSAPVWIEPRVFKDRARADDDPPAGLARGAPEPAPPPKAARLPLKEGSRQVEDAAVTTLRLGAEEVLPCLCWSDDGRSFFYLDGPRGVLGQVALDGLAEVRRLEVGGKCSWLSASAEGLLVTVAERSQVWVVDPQGLRVKARLDVPGAERAVSAPGLSVAFARGTPLGFPGGAHLYALDLRAGTVGRAAIDGLPDKFLPAWQGARLTADGKYLFTRHTELNRFRVDGPRLTYEDTGPNVVGQGRVVDLVLSPDSRFACLPAGGGNDIAGPFPGRPELRRYSLYVYPVRDLHRPAFPLEVGAYPTVMGFDPAARLVYAKNSDYQLMVFDETGQLKKQYQISNPTDEVRQFLAHPKGRKLLLLANKLYLVELGPE